MNRDLFRTGPAQMNERFITGLAGVSKSTFAFRPSVLTPDVSHADDFWKEPGLLKLITPRLTARAAHS